jgi:hypothetical protein
VSLTFPFGWGLVQKGGLGAERAVLGGKPALQYQSAPGAAGPVAVQLLTLPVGNYRLWVKAAESGTADAPAAYWTLTCAEPGGRQIALLDQPAQGGAAAQADFAVAPGCKAQWLALSVMAGDNPDHLGAVAAVRVGRSQTDVVRRN